MIDPHDGRPGPRSLERIVVAYDGSPASVRAAEVGISLAVALRGRLWFVHAHRRGASVAEPLTEEASTAPLRAVARSLESFVAHASARGVVAEAVVREGDPADILRQVVEVTGAGLAVVGTRGHGAAGRLLLGSVSAKVVGFGSVPVIVVP